MSTPRLRTVVVVLGVVGCLMVAGGWAHASLAPQSADPQALVAGPPAAGLDGAAPAGAEGARGKRGRKAAAATAKITLDDKEYVISLIPAGEGKRKKGDAAGDAKKAKGGGKKGGKAGKSGKKGGKRKGR